MTNNPELIKQVIDNIKKLSKEDLDKVMKEADGWYNKEINSPNINSIEEDVRILKRYLQNFKCYDEIIKNDEIIKIIDYKEIKAIENILNEFKKYRHAMIMISEICVDESKLHITSAEAIEEIRKNIY